MSRGGKPGNPHDWINYDRAHEYFITPEITTKSGADLLQQTRKLLNDAIQSGTVRFKKPDSVYKAGMVNRIDLLEFTVGKQPHATEGFPDTARKRRNYIKRLKNWLSAFPKPWS